MMRFAILLYQQETSIQHNKIDVLLDFLKRGYLQSFNRNKKYPIFLLIFLLQLPPFPFTNEL